MFGVASNSAPRALGNRALAVDQLGGLYNAFDKPRIDYITSYCQGDFADLELGYAPHMFDVDESISCGKLKRLSEFSPPCVRGT